MCGKNEATVSFFNLHCLTLYFWREKHGLGESKGWGGAGAKIRPTISCCLVSIQLFLIAVRKI